MGAGSGDRPKLQGVVAIPDWDWWIGTDRLAAMITAIQSANQSIALCSGEIAQGNLDGLMLADRELRRRAGR